MNTAKKIKMIVWGVNILLFSAVVFCGIEQAGKGAEIAKLNNQLSTLSVQKQSLAESLLSGNTLEKTQEKAQQLGYVKPSNVLYFDSEEIFAKLPVR